MAKRKGSNRKDASKAKKSKNSRSRIPVTILSGFLGSGKTTLLQYILKSKDHGLKIAVIVNDMAELNVDGQTVSRTKKEVVTLENGCICCTLRGDLIKEIQRIQEDTTNNFDYVLIESTGIAEPQQVAESFCVDPETLELTGNDESMLWNAARLDTCVTVVDAVNFPNYLSSLKRFKDIFRDGLDDAEEGEGQKSICELMVEQVEFSNVIVLNKIDLVSDKKLEISKELIRALNPKAKVVTTTYAEMNLNDIMNTHMFNLEEASKSPGWLMSLQNGATTDAGEADEYGVSSFVFRARRPFHPQRLHDFLRRFFCFATEWSTSDAAKIEQEYGKEIDKEYGSIFRSKGTCWIAGHDQHEMGWTQAGRIIQLSLIAPWCCLTPPEEWDGVDDQMERSMIQERLEGQTYGDRRQEIVFIGTKLQQAALEKRLAECLLTETEMIEHSVDHLPVGHYPDPLLPSLVPCDDATSLFLITRQGQNQHIRIFPGFEVTLCCLALHIVQNEHAHRIAVAKVWLDPTDAVAKGVLLATLRPHTHEHHAISVPLLPHAEDKEEPTTHRIRIEVVPKMKKNDAMVEQIPMETCEVHIVGRVDLLPYSAADADCKDGDDDNR